MQNTLFSISFSSFIAMQFNQINQVLALVSFVAMMLVCRKAIKEEWI